MLQSYLVTYSIPLRLEYFLYQFVFRLFEFIFSA
jgi:hypothetical protein